jgi:putative membrane protein
MSKARSKRITRFLIILGVIAPVLLALSAVWSLNPTSTDSATGQPNLNAAIVNEDEIVTTTVSGKQIPVAAGRLLVGQLVASKNDGFNWTITDSSVAQQGLTNGTYALVLTIPANFTKAYISATTSAPLQATVDITTDGSHSYVATVLSRAMATTLTAQLSQKFTQLYITGLLSGYSALSTELGKAAAGQQLLANGLGALTTATEVLPGANSALAKGADLLAAGNKGLASGLGSLSTLSKTNQSKLTQLSTLNSQLRTELNANNVPAALSTLSDIDALTLDLQANGVLIKGGIGLAQGVASGLGTGTKYLADGAQLLADNLPLLTDGMKAATGGAQAVASGLSAAAKALPKYSSAQTNTLSQVITTPIVAQITTTPTLPSAQSAMGAITIPIALWLGALILALVSRPFARRNLLSRASSTRLVVETALPTIGLAAAQGALVILGAIASGITAVDHFGLFAVIMAASISFALLHVGFAALVPRATWLLSIALLGLQIISAGVILPLSTAPAFIQTLGEVMPLSIAMRGCQSLITGGTVGALASVVGVGLSGLLGLILLAIAVNRGRRISTPAGVPVELASAN